MRGHPRTPLDKAKATGRTAVNPARFKGRSEPASRPLGKPSPKLQGEELVAWEAFKREVTWLMESDRATVEAASKLRPKVLDGTITDNSLGKYLSLLSRMGATPADRSRIHVPKDQQASPEDEFVN